ncbi:MAG: sigma-70 family RNA polymerase sigma factor [Phycisphaerales bacterium]
MTAANGLAGLNRDDQAIVRELLAMDEPIDFMDQDAFYEAGAERAIFDDAPKVRRADASWYHPLMEGLESNRSIKQNEQVVLTAAEERIIFSQFNYARCRVSQLQGEVFETPSRVPTAEQARALATWYHTAKRLREQIAETNLALVLAMAKRTRMSEIDFADLISEGNMALLRAIDKFDCTRGFKFSTYACRAIIKAFSRQGMKLSKYRSHFPAEFDPTMEKSNYLETKRAEQVTDTADHLRYIVLSNGAGLTDIERTVIEHRFRLESGQVDERPLTLEQVGQIIGVTKERVRQIQNKALDKLRTELEDSFISPEQREKDDMSDAHLMN